ncbi:MAG TPA: hypothetical protein VFP69_13065 [Streptomyces sp.]|nr:hypothetical protein [Streptomyces sp.]
MADQTPSGPRDTGRRPSKGPGPARVVSAQRTGSAWPSPSSRPALSPEPGADDIPVRLALARLTLARFTRTPQ